MINIFIGFDQVESSAFYTLQHSIMKHSSLPVRITPLYLPNLRECFIRDRDPMQSNDFSFSRWLVPYLSEYKGWSIFMDCDMLCRGDIAELWDLRQHQYAVQVVKHEHKPTEKVKYLGRAQHTYEKKNWSSLMLFNNNACKDLTLFATHHLSGLELHQFKWTEEDKIGRLPGMWNHLVGYDEPNKDVQLAHFTTGGPYFTEYRDCEFADEWHAAYKEMIHCEQS